jgi:hypothetical protein
MRSRIEPMKKFARTLREHREWLRNYFQARKEFFQRCRRGSQQQGHSCHEKILRLPHLPRPRTRPRSLTCQAARAYPRPHILLTNPKFKDRRSIGVVSPINNERLDVRHLTRQVANISRARRECLRWKRTPRKRTISNRPGFFEDSLEMLRMMHSASYFRRSRRRTNLAVSTRSNADDPGVGFFQRYRYQASWHCTDSERRDFANNTVPMCVLVKKSRKGLFETTKCR